MSTETTRLIREEGQTLYRALRKEVYLNHSGQKSKTEITEIFKSFRDLLEPEIFQSLKNTTSNTPEEENGIKLMLGFLAEINLLGKSSQIEDGILDFEASSIFTVEHIRKHCLINLKNKKLKRLKKKGTTYYQN